MEVSRHSQSPGVYRIKEIYPFLQDLSLCLEQVLNQTKHSPQRFRNHLQCFHELLCNQVIVPVVQYLSLFRRFLPVILNLSFFSTFICSFEVICRQPDRHTIVNCLQLLFFTLPLVFFFFFALPLIVQKSRESIEKKIEGKLVLLHEHLKNL